MCSNVVICSFFYVKIILLGYEFHMLRNPNKHQIDRNGVPKCPNCAREGLEVPLKEDGDSMICSLCEYSEKIQ